MVFPVGCGVTEFDWMAQGSCNGRPLDWWFDASTEQMALRICATCPVRTDCFEYAVNDTDINVGVFGGSTGRTRNDERRRRGIRVPHRYEGAYRARRTTPRKAEP